MTRPETSPALLLKLLLAFALAGVAAALVLRGDGGGEATPPVETLVLAGSLITALTIGALWWGLRSDLGLPAKVAVYAVGFNALVVLVKFVLAPSGFYEVNRSVPLEVLFVRPDDPAGALAIGMIVLGLYLGAYWAIYELARRWVERTAALDRPEGRIRTRHVVVAMAVGGLLIAGTGGALVLLLPLALFDGLEYLHFVFTSSLSLVIGFALAGATALAALAFRSVAERAAVVGDAAVLLSFFWLGLYFLALYHALWVVYVLILTSIWPIKVVVPK